MKPDGQAQAFYSLANGNSSVWIQPSYPIANGFITISQPNTPDIKVFLSTETYDQLLITSFQRTSFYESALPDYDVSFSAILLLPQTSQFQGIPLPLSKQYKH